MSKDIFHLHAEICKMLANPKRLEILNVLRETEMTAGEIVHRLNIAKANGSQHLALMRKAGILRSRREGLNIYYSVASPKVLTACDLMREVLLEHHSQRGKALKNRK